MPDDIAVSPGTGDKMVATQVTRPNGVAKVQGTELYLVEPGTEGSRTGTPFGDVFGRTADAANLTGAAGTAMGFWRGLVTMLGAAADPTNALIRVAVNVLRADQDSVRARKLIVEPMPGTTIVNTTEAVISNAAVGSGLPGSGYRWVMTGYAAALLGADQASGVTATVRNGSGTADYWPVTLFKQGSYIKVNFDGEWLLTANTALYGKLDAGFTGGVRFIPFLEKRLVSEG